MTFIKNKIQEFEARTPAFDDAEQSRRLAMLQHFSAINKFEGYIPSAIDKRLFQLLASGKISKQEYLELCIAYARASQKKPCEA